ELVEVDHRQGAGRASLHAQAAADAAQVVDLVVLAVPLARGVARLLGVVAALDVDGVRGACPRAQLTTDALLQPVRMPVELVTAGITRRGRRPGLRVLLRGHLLEHRREGDTEAFDGIKDPHRLPPYLS